MMGNRFLILFLCVLFVFCAKAQPIFDASGGFSYGQAGSSVTHSNLFSVQNNQGSLANLNQNEIGIFNAIPFSINNLATTNISMAGKFKYFNGGIAFTQFGYNLFSQQRATMAIAKKLSEMVSIGIGFSYLATNIAEQPTVHNIVGETGILFEPKKGINFGMYVFNPTMVKYKNGLNDRITSLARFGIGYNVSKELTLNSEYEKAINRNDIIRASLQYRFNNYIELMCGWANQPAKFGFGSNIYYKKWQFLFAGNVHQTLGLTPSVSIIFKHAK